MTRLTKLIARLEAEVRLQWCAALPPLSSLKVKPAMEVTFDSNDLNHGIASQHL